MKKTILSGLFLLFSIQHVLHAQSNDTLYRIATWKRFAKAAVSYTWDDNTAKQLTDALPLFDRYGFNVTFFVITSASPNWIGLKQAQSKGHEVASHTITHTALNTLPDTTQERELLESRSTINAQMMNSKCITLAYPFCASGNRSITEKYYISARGCDGQIEHKTPSDFMNVSSIICGTQGAVETAQEFNSRVDLATATNGWAVFLLHGINNDGGYSPVDSAELSHHLDFMNNNRNSYWIDTYGTIVRYIQERDAAVAHEWSSTDSLIVFSITHALDTAVYDLALTLQRAVPNNWEKFSVWQDGKILNATVTEENGGKYMVLEVMPNKGNISIRREKATGMDEDALTSSFIVYPNPVSTSATIRWKLKEKTSVSITLLDASGRIIWHLAEANYGAGSHEVMMDAVHLKDGNYYCVLHANGRSMTRTMVVSGK
jgi:oligosaccharide reducing-end xylanase